MLLLILYLSHFKFQPLELGHRVIIWGVAGSSRVSQVVLVVKNLANVGDLRHAGSIPGSGRSLGGGHDNPLQYSCLENPMDRGAWPATVHRVTKSRTLLKQLSLGYRIRCFTLLLFMFFSYFQLLWNEHFIT